MRPSRVLFIASALLLLACGCSTGTHQQATTPSAADLMIQYGCPTCHVIPHVPAAIGKVGPPLNDIAQRSYLAGMLPNSPENLKLWIMHPQHFEPGTAMPEMGVTPADAQAIADYLQNTGR